MMCLTGIITSLHDRSLNQSEMDTKYDELITVIYSEMEANGMYKDVTPTMRKRKKTVQTILEWWVRSAMGGCTWQRGTIHEENHPLKIMGGVLARQIPP